MQVHPGPPDVVRRRTQFQPGQSGNPSGRKSADKDAKELAKKNCHKAMQKLIEMLDDEDSRVVLAAAREILDRGLGKAPSAPEDNDAIGKGGVQINIVRLEQKAPEPVKVIDHDDHAAEQRLAAPTVSIRTVGVSTERGQESGSGLPPEMGQG